MEITPFTVYLFTRLDSLNALFGILFFVSLLIAGAFNFFYYTEKEEIISQKTNIIFSLIIFFFGVFSVLIPDQKEAAAIILLPKIVNSEKTGVIADKSFEILKLKLDEYILDLKGNKDEK